MITIETVFAFFVVGMLEILAYHYITERYSKGKVTKRQFTLLEDDVLDLQEDYMAVKTNVRKISVRLNTAAGREQKADNMTALYSHLPQLLENLPIDDKLKAVLLKLPPGAIGEVVKTVQKNILTE